MYYLTAYRLFLHLNGVQNYIWNAAEDTHRLLYFILNVQLLLFVETK